MAPFKKYPFIKNNCRLCSKTFCCEKCRLKHEANFHKVDPFCEICIYGRAYLKENSVSLFSHVVEKHWPLHCVFCKKTLTSIDELLPHTKCIIKMEIGTPKTPNIEKEESPEVTPFYKNLNVGAGAKHAITSTPLPCQIIQKSNLKLTGSSNLSDSKKHERRVTFLETPKYSINQSKEQTYSIAECQEPPIANDDSLSSIEDCFKTACSENKENCNIDKCDGTLWESALNYSTETPNPNINVALQINVYNNTICSNLGESSRSTNLWNSMSKMVKSVVNNISLSAQNSFSNKRLQLDDPDAPSLKRMKLTDIKCRRPIRDISPSYSNRFVTPKFVDKATQTDD